MTILVDYTQLAIAGIMQFQADLKNGSDEKIVNLIRHVILSSLVANNKRFKNEYGEMVICTDGRSYWRKEIFPYYKANRSKDREKSDLNWKLIFDTISGIREDLKQHFPYKVIHVERAEADDCIGVITNYLQCNDLIQVGVMEEPRPVLILSSDKDNIQLQKHRNVKQYSPIQKKFVTPDTKAIYSLIEKICTGDTGDGIPNIMSSDNSLADGIRQKSFRKDRLQEFYEHGINACRTDEERRNFQRNQKLVSYDHIPADVAAEITEAYINQQPQGSKSRIMNYLMEHRCRNLMDSIEDF